MDVIRFGPLDVRSDALVLQPRPWTQAQSRWAAELATALPPGPYLELCAGVGHIGLLLASLVPRELVLVDGDRHACEYARANARAAALPVQVDVRHGAVDAVLEPEERFALILADPPWVVSGETWRFPDDPVYAIDGGTDGLAVARVCVEVIAHHLADGGICIMQLGNEAQVASLGVHLAQRTGPPLRIAEVRALPDVNGVLVQLVRGSDLARLERSDGAHDRPRRTAPGPDVAPHRDLPHRDLDGSPQSWGP
jgi:methylase of polypeptide subunit release factors